MSFVSSIVGGIMGASAAGKAANVEAQGAQQAQKTIEQNQTNAIGAQDTALSNVTAAEQPYQTLGSTSANHLADLVSKGFTAPTLAEAEATPGYQFTLGQGEDAIKRNAAATGTLMSGNTGKALTDYATGLASTTYQQDYQNALNTYMSNYQTLMGGTNAGLTSTGQLEGANLTTAGNTANIDLSSADMIAKQINNAAAARASGILGKAQGYSSAIGGVINGATGFLPGGQFANLFNRGGDESSADYNATAWGG
jgi:hypothetical protein